MLDPVEAFLTRLQHPVMAGVDLKLERMQRFLSLLGMPQRRLPPVIHVAGTNGKGSLLAYLNAIFEAAGYRVHRYTSPHLIEFRERILLYGKMIEPGYLQSILKHVAGVLPQQLVTFFEATTALAFLAFADNPADVLLMETGVGGRLDATNVIEHPILTAITPISFDHCEYLGDTLAKIAAEKAGIIKKGVPCVIGRQHPEAEEVLVKAAEKLQAPLFRMGHEWHIDGASYRSPRRTLILHPSLAGAHQLDNAATAVACVDSLPQFSISDAQVAKGLASAAWPARLQNLRDGRYARLLPAGIELWLDGGHNPEGGAVLSRWLKERGAAEIYLICGMMKRKDAAGYLAPLVPQVTALYGVDIPDEPQCLPAGQVVMAARGVGMAAEAADSVEKALQSIAGRAKTPALVCICGSLYLAGRVLAVEAAGV